MFSFSEQTWFRFKSLIILEIILIHLVKGSTTFDHNVTASPNICNTSRCKEAASYILEHMDQSVDPCENFYDFVCGNFMKNAVIPEDRPAAAYIIEIRDKVQKQLSSSIENEITENDPRSFKLLKSYYNVCMNEDQIDKTSECEFLDFLETLGGWPVLIGDAWNETSFDWRIMMLKLRETGFQFNQFIDVRIDKDMKSSSRRLVHLDQASLGINQNYLRKGLNDSVVKAYFKYMVDFAVLFGVDRARAVHELGQSLDLEIKLAKISLTSVQRRNITKLYNPMTVEELQSHYPSKNHDGPTLYPIWIIYLNDLLRPHAFLRENDLVIVEDTSFLDDLADLLRSTPSRVQANYVFWRVAESVAHTLSERVNKVLREFSASITGIQKKIPRWQICTNRANHVMNLAAGALWTRRHVDKKTKESATELFTNIAKTFKGMLEEVNWMSKETKTAALEKLEQMTPMIAYPDEFLDDEKIDNYYRELQIDPESFLKSTLSINLFTLAHTNELLDKPFNKTDWTSFGSAAIVNAYNAIEKNVMGFPAGMLQENYFDKDNPKYMNYGGIGMIAGHEMTHGFDDSGRLYDKDGNLLDWWGGSTANKYLEKAKCIINQYSNYIAKEVNLHLDGENTQGENIADNGGIKEAYFAYEAWEKENGPEPRLPGLETYTPRQCFWMNNAIIWSSKYRPEHLRNIILTDPHSPGEFRINGPMSNMPEFARDFNCPYGSPMNPAEKCTVW